MDRTKILNYYKDVTKPYVKPIIDLFKSRPGIAVASCFILTVIGIVFCILPRRSVDFLTYNHASVVVTILGWFLLEKFIDNPSKSTYFFVGGSCAHLTYILNSDVLLSSIIRLILVVTLFYSPFLDISYKCELIAFFVINCIFLYFIFRLNKNHFVVVCVTFIGSCLSTIAISLLLLLLKFNKDFLNKVTDSAISPKERLLKFVGLIESPMYTPDNFDFMNLTSIIILMTTWCVSLVFNYFVVGVRRSRKYKIKERKCNKYK